MVDVPCQVGIVEYPNGKTGGDGHPVMDLERARTVGEREVRSGRKTEDVRPVADAIGHERDAGEVGDRAQIAGSGEVGVGDDDDVDSPVGQSAPPELGGGVESRCRGDGGVGAETAGPGAYVGVVVHHENRQLVGGANHGGGHGRHEIPALVGGERRGQTDLAVGERPYRHDDADPIRHPTRHGASLGFDTMRSLAVRSGVRHWNSIGTLATGPIADVDAAGGVADRRRPVTVELWVRAGDRWTLPTDGADTRQRRVEGFPIVETRRRTGGEDVVVTAWADEGGDGRGRVLLQVENRTDQPAAIATVVRPRTVLGVGSAHSIRVVDRMIVVDGRPLVALPKPPGDIAVGSNELGDVDHRLGDSLVGDAAVEAADGSAALAAVWPLPAGGSEIVAVVDGRTRVDTAPAPLDRVLSGWRAHVGTGASVLLPGWPDHLWNALVSGLLLRVEESTPPLGSDADRRRDVAVASALALAGQDRPASLELDRLLDVVVGGGIAYEHWPDVAVACGLLAGLAGDGENASIVERVLTRHPATVAALAGELLAHPLSRPARHGLLRAVELAAGSRAAGDAAEITEDQGDGGGVSDRTLERLVRLGLELHPDGWDRLHPPEVEGADVEDLALHLVLAARGRPGADVVPAVRAAAGSSWRWELDGAGDSPYARAALVVGLRSAAVRETENGLDIAPGFDDRWLGRSADVRSLPTICGRLSYSIRWHGARPALLWELEPVDVEAVEAPVEIVCGAVDPGFASTDSTGEVLLSEPTVAR